MLDDSFRLPDEALEASAAIRRRWDARPVAGLILGTGLGNVASYIETDATIDFEAIPHFPRSTALSHRGRLVCGRLGDTPLVVMEGRWHYYEGHSIDRLTLPVYVMRALGVELLILSNASGGLNPRFASGDVMVIEDHINLMFWKQAPRMEKESDSSRQPAPHPYDRALIEQALAISRRENFVAHRGVYVAMTGPSYETRAEYRFLRRIGADVVGMSTVPEAVAAARCGMRMLALSTVTNVARPDNPEVTTAEDVVAAAERAEPNVRRIILDILREPWDACGSGVSE
ncbi:MAG: purine-nucleoside phosphorylase [Planctomycetes bacterium]|nr:purine-nucleoside phosphorylase [Planctomycetota bacterium]MBL7041863.1 purine-nucleoside phosphorylase [Pirellulaceae bacterium]